MATGAQWPPARCPRAHLLLTHVSPQPAGRLGILVASFEHTGASTRGQDGRPRPAVSSKEVAMLKRDCKHYDLVSVTYPDTGKTVWYAFCQHYKRRESRMQAKDLCPADCPMYQPTGIEKRRRA